MSTDIALSRVRSQHCASRVTGLYGLTGDLLGISARPVLREIAMLRKRLLLALLLAAPAAHAESWTYLGTLDPAVSLADGVYDVRVILRDAETLRPRMAPFTLHRVTIAGGAFSMRLELGDAMQASAGQPSGPLVLTAELSSDGVHFVAINPSPRFDAASAHIGVCWNPTNTGPTPPAAQNATTCLLPTSLLAQMGPTGGVYELTRQMIAGGGRSVSGGSYVLVGTVGQSALTPVSGGAYQIIGGFHGPATAGPPFDLIFRSGFDN